MATLRLFIAIDIPTEIKSQIAEVIRDLKSSNADVRWEQIDKLHITLKFLGNTEEATLERVLTSLDHITQRTFSFIIKYASVGCFPNRQAPRIIWVGVQDMDSALQPLANTVDDSMKELGFEKEQREFHAHVTLGRVKSQRSMQDLLRRMESFTFESQSTIVSEIALVKSETKSTGSLHTILKRFPFSIRQ